MLDIKNCLGLILRTQPYSDSDLIMTILTEKHGKLGAIARKSKAGRKSQGGQPETMDIGYFDLHQSRLDAQLLNIRGFRPHKSFMGIRSNMAAFICACGWIEAIEHLTSEAHHESGELYQLAANVLAEIDRETDQKLILRSLCQGLEHVLMQSGFGFDFQQMPVGLKKLKALVLRIKDVSARDLKSWESIFDLATRLSPDPS